MDEYGFAFENCKRNNKFLNDEKIKKSLPSFKKTGTTIAGVVFGDGVIVGADTRATQDTIVAEKNCLKVHYLTDNIFACGAGTSADLLKVSDLISANLKLAELNSGRKIRVITAVTVARQYLFQHEGMIGAYLIIGGVDFTGPHLYSVSNRGHSDTLPFVTNGSGCLAAMSYFENNFQPNMSLEEATNFVAQGISAGVCNDLGSGSNVDMCVITKHGMKMLRNYMVLFSKPSLNRDYTFISGTTPIKSRTINHIPYQIISSEKSAK